jgi:nitroreductase
MEFNQVLHSRRSIRAFSDQAVPQHVIDSILTDAIESPSSSNTQPYKIAVATGDTCKQLGQALLEKYRNTGRDPNFLIYQNAY